MKEFNQSNSENKLSNFALFITFLTLAWSVYLFPDIIGDISDNILIAKILLIIGVFFISTFGNENSKDLYENLGVGLGFVIIWLAFYADLPMNWYFRMPFFIIFGMFGCFGVYQAIIRQSIQLYNLYTSKTPTYGKTLHSKNRKFITGKFVIQLIEVLAALATILQFIGIEL
ncbi:Uncharacterised protein [Streptococcus suis]|uniref:Uncharacterized protein n=1 Tax=Streptococcus suis TaxID=1307 RepID=A0A0Z8H153_STRSU|nr:hypothetical protein [Streptococcus suis]NQH35549.1 hypothetical protein [Streptococcus suis]CYV08532.1 Uncharacterised protein [Streptococcus suis]